MIKKRRGKQTDMQTDLNWIAENLDLLLLGGATFFEEHGRGAMVIDHSKSGVPDPPVHYVRDTEPNLPSYTKRMLREYDPTTQAVVTMLKQGREDTYRIASRRTTRVQ